MVGSLGRGQSGGNIQIKGVIISIQAYGSSVTAQPQSTLPSPQSHPLFYLGIYSGISFATTLMAVMAQWALSTGGLRAGKFSFSCQ